MREQANIANADWNVVLEAHNAQHGGPDWKNLMILVGRSMPGVEREFSRSDKTLLLVNSDVLALYNRIDLLECLRDRVWGTRNELHGVWTLMKRGERESPPPLVGLVEQTLLRNQLAHIPEGWINGS